MTQPNTEPGEWHVRPNGEHSSNIDYLERNDNLSFSTVTAVAAELNRLAADLAALRREIAELQDLLNLSQAEVRTRLDDIRQLEQRLATAEADSRRLDWLLSAGLVLKGKSVSIGEERQAIDKAAEGASPASDCPIPGP